MTGTNAPGSRSGRGATTGLADPFLKAKLHRPPTREHRVVREAGP
jgi:hypothetical protein